MENITSPKGLYPKHCKKLTMPKTVPKHNPTNGPPKIAPIAIGMTVSVISNPNVLMGRKAITTTSAAKIAVSVIF